MALIVCVGYKRLQGYKANKPKTEQNFCAEHGWLFLICTLDYGILCVHRRKIFDIGKPWRERCPPRPAFVQTKLKESPFTGHGAEKQFVPSLASRSGCKSGTAALPVCCAVLLNDVLWPGDNEGILVELEVP